MSVSDMDFKWARCMDGRGKRGYLGLRMTGGSSVVCEYKCECGLGNSVCIISEE